MKVVSWNIGNFIWIKHFPGRDHYAFQRDNIDEVIPVLKHANADVMFLQEVLPEDCDLIAEHFEDHKYRLSIHTGERESVSLFISRFPIEDIEHTHSHDYRINGVTFFPIHLYAFSPRVRHMQTRNLLPDLPGKKGVILGDTNFWILYKKFLSTRDKQSYDAICEDHVDILEHLGPTCRMFLSLDKIFVTKDLRYSHAKITSHRIGHIDHYMISADIDAPDA